MPDLPDSLPLSVRASKRKIVIHKKQINKGRTNYYFTKSKNRCLVIEYEESWDFGKKSTSGTTFHYIQIHYQNSWIKDELKEITLSDVPPVIKDLLRYLA